MDKGDKDEMIMLNPLAALTVLACLTFANSLEAQSSIRLKLTGHNHIAVINPNLYSITVEVEGLQTFVVPGLGFKKIPFRLNRANVEKRLFHTRYDHASFLQDSFLCSRQARQFSIEAETQAELDEMVLLLLKGELTFDNFLLLLKGMSPLLGMTKTGIDSLLINLTKAYATNSTDKHAAISALLESSVKNSPEVRISDMGCMDNARQRLHTIQPHSFNADTFFIKAERASFEISPFGTAGFRATRFRETGTRSSFKTVLFGIEPSYGVRVSYKFNAYDQYKTRNSGIQSYIPVTAFKSHAVYRNEPDSFFSKNQTRQWYFVSAGFGQELNNKDGSSRPTKWALLYDFGLISGMVFTGILDSAGGTIRNRQKQPGLAGIVPYINAGYKQRVTRWLDVYLSYYSTFFYKSLVHDKKDMPRFRQFNLGLNIVLFRKISYQY